MLGETVVLFVREAAGEDPMGEPVVEWHAYKVENALVMPKASAPVEDEGRADAVRALFSVALPKAFTADMPRLANGRLALADRGMDERDAYGALHIIGDPARTIPCPTPWDVLFDVGRVDG